MADINELVGKVVVSYRVENNCDIYLKCETGENYRFVHEQDCCESVSIESIEGDLDSLIGNPILLAEVRACDLPAQDEQWDESFTWTFYTLATIKGHIDIRWYGTSNGYYSESVDFEKFNQEHAENWRGGWE